ncbi:MAG: hypothetical protein K2G52_10060 [Muribaculaceae bacterium]|nr:hypothetical protein [Muribaculaceae bacterium]
MKLIFFVMSVMSVFFMHAQNTLCQDSTNTVGPDSIERTLDEVVIIRKQVSTDGRTKTYTITPEMRKKAYNTAHLIGNLPGMYVDRMTNEMEYLGRKNIKILVDSIEKDESYIKRLSPGRFSKVEMTVNPTGRYSGYDVLINLRLKPRYTGTELSLSSFNVVRPDYVTSDKFSVSNEYGFLDYMNEHWNAYLTESFTWMNIQQQELYDRWYPVNEIREYSISNPGRVPTKQDYVRRNEVAVNVDYTVNPHHIIGVTYAINYLNDNSTGNSLIVSEHGRLPLSDTCYNRDSSGKDGFTNMAGIFYEGRNLLGWNIGAKLNYVNNSHDTDNTYSRTSGYHEDYLNRQRMYYSFAGMNMGRNFFGRLDLNLGYDYINRNLKIMDRVTGETLSRLRENRHHARLSADMRIFSETYVGAGVSFLHNHTHSSGTKSSENLWSFQCRMTHTFSDNLSAELSYLGTICPPTTSQLSDYGQFVSPIQFVTGNPALKIPRNHFFECSVDFLDMFNIRGSLTVDPDRIGSVVESRVGTRPDGTEGPYVVAMPDNYYLRYWSIDMSFYKSIGNFDINARVNWETDRGRYKDWSMSKSGFSVDASLRYYIPDAGMYAEIEYETPQPYSIDNAMAWSEDTQDYLKIDIGKRFLKGKLNVMVRYLPPVHFLSDRKTDYIMSPALKSSLTSRSNRLNDNSVMISLSYYFQGGNRIFRLRKDMHKEE